MCAIVQGNTGKISIGVTGSSDDRVITALCGSSNALDSGSRQHVNWQQDVQKVLTYYTSRRC